VSFCHIEANLTNASLRGANLTDAILKDALFDGAALEGVVRDKPLGSRSPKGLRGRSRKNRGAGSGTPDVNPSPRE
jgi:hypothetical protein